MSVVSKCGHWLRSVGVVSECGQLGGGYLLGAQGVWLLVWSVVVVSGVNSGCGGWMWSVEWSLGVVTGGGQWVWSVRGGNLVWSFWTVGVVSGYGQ